MTYSVDGKTKESIRNIARSLLTIVPDCVDQSDKKAVVAYRVGVMKLAEALTGQNAMEADRETVNRTSTGNGA